MLLQKQIHIQTALNILLAMIAENYKISILKIPIAFNTLHQYAEFFIMLALTGQVREQVVYPLALNKSKRVGHFISER